MIERKGRPVYCLGQEKYGLGREEYDLGQEKCVLGQEHRTIVMVSDYQIMILYEKKASLDYQEFVFINASI